MKDVHVGGQWGEASVANRRASKLHNREAPCNRGIFNTSRVSSDNANVDGVKTKQSRCGQHTSIGLNEISCKCSMTLWQQAVRETQKGFTNQAVVFICTSHIDAYTIYSCTSAGLNVSDVSGLWETRRGGGEVPLSDTSALSHYSLVSVTVCRKVVISINYNYNELGSSEISLRETALKGRRTLKTYLCRLHGQQFP